MHWSVSFLTITILESHSFAKEIFNQIKENTEYNINEFLNKGFLASINNNNIKEAEKLINNGANIEVEMLSKYEKLIVN